MPITKSLVVIVFTTALALCCPHSIAAQDTAAESYVTLCRPSSAILEDSGARIVRDSACASSGDRSACINDHCRFCQVFPTEFSEALLPCSDPILLAEPVAVVSIGDGLPEPSEAADPGTASSEPTTPTPSIVTPTTEPSSALTAIPVTIAPATESPEPSPPAPSPVVISTPSAAPADPIPADPVSAVPAAIDLEPSTPAPTLVTTTSSASSSSAPSGAPAPQIGFDPELIDCSADLTAFSAANGISALLDLTCVDDADAASCIDALCRLCWVEQTDVSSRYPACQSILDRQAR